MEWTNKDFDETTKKLKEIKKKKCDFKYGQKKLSGLVVRHQATHGSGRATCSVNAPLQTSPPCLLITLVLCNTACPLWTLHAIYVHCMPFALYEHTCPSCTFHACNEHCRSMSYISSMVYQLSVHIIYAPRLPLKKSGFLVQGDQKVLPTKIFKFY